MAAVAFPPGGPAKTPEQLIDEHADAMADICKKLLARVAYLEKENGKVHGQLDDALDRVNELNDDIARLHKALVAAQAETVKP